MRYSPLIPPLTKSHGSLGPGERWITVTPPGHDKGSPVLIRENPDGSAHIIGGAGGKLTGLRIHPRKPGETAAQAAAAQQEARKKARAEQTEKDKAAGLHEAKQEARRSIAEQRKAAEKEFIAAVAKAKGWDEASLEFDPSKFPDATPQALQALERRHHQAVLKSANAQAREAQNQAALDHGAREQAIGEIPLNSTDPDELSVADLDPVAPRGAGLGFAPGYADRAASVGFTKEEADAVTSAAKEAKLAALTPEQRQAALSSGESKELLKAELEALRDRPLFDPKGEEKQASMSAALEILAARKKLQIIRQKAAEANKAVDGAGTLPKAFSLAVTAEDGEIAGAVRAGIERDLQTIAARSFLSEVDAHDRGALGRHIGVGAFNSLNAAGLTVAGAGLIDRSVVDVLGIGAAAQVVAARLRDTISPEDFDKARSAMEEFHASTYAESAKGAVEQAKKWQGIAESIELPESIRTGEDMELAQDLNAKRRDAIGEARRALGTALGETEANAALVAAMQGPVNTLEVPMGKITAGAAATQLAALGLKSGDYGLEQAGGETILTVNKNGIRRLSSAVHREDLLQLKRSQAIIRGDEDEEGWLPEGFANRPDIGLNLQPGIAPRLAQPFDPSGGNIQQALRDYIGGRAADGDHPSDILADVQSAEFAKKAGSIDAYFAALQEVAPLKSKNGKLRRAEDFAGIFDGYADAFVESQYGGNRSTLNKQGLDIDDVSVEALHRTLSDHPEGIAAFKAIGNLTPQDQRTLRDHFAKNVAKESPDEEAARVRVEELDASEPEATVTDMFGDTTTNPQWTEWKADRDLAAEKLNGLSLGWPKYVKAMRGTEKAYEAVQDLIRSSISGKFAEHHNRLRPDAPIKTGITSIRNNLRHLDTVDPAARAARQAKEAALRDSLRERAGGKYASGSVKDKIDAARERNQAMEDAQMGFFSSEELPEDAKARGLAADERHTIGHAAERQLAKMVTSVGQNFKPGDPVKLWAPSMSGKFAPQQRAIKMLEANKRLGGAMGAGSGKTAVMLGGFSHLHSKGKVKRALMLVPSVVQGQFGGEALRYLKPDTYKWHIEPGASRESRIAAYKDASTHFAVMTHQSFRDDMLHLGAKHAGVDENAMAAKVGKMSPDQRQEWAKGVMEREGINFDMTMVDEAHETLNRAGKENSSLANVVDAVSDSTPYYGYFSGDPVKNDASEIHSLLSKLDRSRYGDRDAFMRKYGADTLASEGSLRRELSRYVFPNRITSGVNAEKKTVEVDLTPGQRAALKELDGHFSSAKLARLRGEVAVDAMKAISPQSFDGVPEAKHPETARRLQKSLGIMRSSAVRRVINSHQDNAKMDAMMKEVEARPGQQGVVFAHARADVAGIKARLEAAGKRVVTVTGEDGAKEKDRKRKLFNPENGAAKADILLASDAAAVGMNLQSGRYLIQHDTPDTAKGHGQRNARIDRIGQKNDVDLIDLVAKHREEYRARDRLERKYGLRDLMTSPLDGLDDTGLAYFLKQQQKQDTGDLLDGV